VERRDFLRGALGLGVAGSLGAFAAASLGFLWPQLGEGFGAVMNLGNAEELRQQIAENRAPYEYPPGRLFVTMWDPTIAGAMEQYGEDHTALLDDNVALMALFQQCVHLGCRVPWCLTSQWWECPCHGSKYNRWGEWTDGPAARGLDRFPSEIDGNGDYLVNTGLLLEGPARTARILQQEPEGPHCIDI
jgi:cytochrome b6-f complex iron-sulfur subunit